MDDGREGLNDLDREIAQALDVDVSPDFVARVRQRIANEPKPAPFWSGWRIAIPIAAAAVAIAAVGLAMLSTRGTSTPPRLAARSLASGQMPPADVQPARAGLGADRLAPSNRVHVVAVSAAAQKEPEVLVPREEIEMYRRLIAQAQTVPGAWLVEPPKDIVASAVISNITIDPIKIDLIIPPVSGEGDRQ